MVSKSSATKRSAPKISSASAPASASVTHKANKSSLLRSSFPPSRLQLSLFVSVIQGLDSQLLRIHDTNSNRLQSTHKIQPKATVNCLDWGHYDSKGQQVDKEQSKKRKRSENVIGLKKDLNDVVVAYGTSFSEIHMYSPKEGKLVETLRDGHTQGIRDFKFNDSIPAAAEGWSLGGDGNLVQWDLRHGTKTKTISLPTPSPSVLLPLASTVLCASNVVYLIDPNNSKKLTSYTGFTKSVQAIVAHATKDSNLPARFLAVDSDTNINIFNVASQQILGSLVAGSNVESLAYYDDQVNTSVDGQMSKALLATVTRDGEIEIFPNPFDVGKSSDKGKSTSLKADRLKRTRKSVATLSLVRPGESRTVIAIQGCSFQGNDIVVAWVDGGTQVEFEKISWRNEANGEMILAGQVRIPVKAAGMAGLRAHTMNGVKDMGHSRIDESRTVVTKGGETGDGPLANGGPEVIDISSGEEESSEDDEDDAIALPVAIANLPPEPVLGGKTITNGDVSGDIEMPDVEPAAAEKSNDAKEEANVDEEPTFGDLLRAKVPETVDVAAAFADPSRQALAPLNEGQVKLPSGMSLGTVLSQSLRTNDVNLLETCLHVHDLDTIRATIERLDSSIATILLQKLAERLHSRPGRAGSLMVWIQWTLVAHGGYLASQPDVVKKLTALQRVVKERASSLQSLLSLKGKLDMLEAQLNLRRSMQSRFGINENRDGDDEEGVIYVEGQDDESSSQEEESESSGEEEAEIKVLNHKSQTQGDVLGQNGILSDSDEEMHEMPTTMEGKVTSSEDEGSDNGDDGLIDDEASESDADSDDESEDEIDHDDVDSGDEDEDSEMEDAPLAKKAATPKMSNGLFTKRR